MQRSIAKLDKEIASLKASLAAANKSHARRSCQDHRALAQGARDHRLDPGDTCRSSNAAAAAEPPPKPARWWYAIGRSVTCATAIVYVRGHGDTYQVQLGAPLPGLGPVQQVKRQDGRWLVVTPKGLIVSMRDRRYFEQF